MKNVILITAVICSLVLTSCSSRYKSTQTPDDLYYSPGEDIIISKNDEINRQRDNKDDAYLHQMVINRNRWRTIDDYCYWQDSRYLNNYSWNNNYYWNNNYNYNWSNYNMGSYNCNCSCNNHWNTSFYNNYYYWNNPSQIFIAYYHPNVIKPFSANNAITYYTNPNYNNTNYNNSFKTNTSQTSNINNNPKIRTANTNNGETIWHTPSRTFSSGSTPSSNAGGNSGGFNSRGSSTGKPRG